MFGGKKNETANRFFCAQKLPSGTVFYTIMDSHTGVNYLVAMFGSSISVTPLLDAAGKVITGPLQ